MSRQDQDYPIEYTLGEVFFYGKKFFVTPDVLIPRLETEGLVRKAREMLKYTRYDTVIDLGTGSGIIGVSLSDLVDVHFVDISEGALSIAKRNFEHTFPEKTCHLHLSDLLDSLSDDLFGNKRVLIVTNLPYIRDGDREHMSPDTAYEPSLALFGGGNTGFELYERLFREIENLPIKYGTCLIEFGFDQREIAEKVLGAYPWSTRFFGDYAGIERFADIQIEKA